MAFVPKINYNSNISLEDNVKAVISVINYATRELTSGRVKRLQVENAELKSENTLLKAQLQAQSSRADFVEDCIAEMAMQVYN